MGRFTSRTEFQCIGLFEMEQSHGQKEQHTDAEVEPNRIQIWHVFPLKETKGQVAGTRQQKRYGPKYFRIKTED